MLAAAEFHIGCVSVGRPPTEGRGRSGAKGRDLVQPKLLPLREVFASFPDRTLLLRFHHRSVSTHVSFRGVPGATEQDLQVP